MTNSYLMYVLFLSRDPDMLMPEIVASCDEYLNEENPEYWPEKVKEKMVLYEGVGELREAIISVPEGDVMELFKPNVIGGHIVEKTPTEKA